MLFGENCQAEETTHLMEMMQLRIEQFFLQLFTEARSGFVTGWFMPASKSSQPSTNKEEKCVSKH